MKITIESTDITVTLVEAGAAIRCRVWEGETEHGVKIHCFIPRISAKDGQDLSQFQAELQEQRAPSAEVLSIPLRMIL